MKSESNVIKLGIIFLKYGLFSYEVNLELRKQ